MGPVIEDGDRVLIRPVNPDSLRVGDIAKFSLGGALRLHRVVAIRRTGEGTVQFTFQGDNQTLPDPPIAEADVLGIAVAVEHGGRLRRLDTPWRRFTGRIRALRSRRRAVSAIGREESRPF